MERYDARTPEAAMVRACSELRVRAAEVHPPFSLHMLAASLGARVEVRPGGPEGRVVVRDGRFVVQMREGASWRRQRFTLAHEVAHLLLFSADAEAGRLRAVPSSSEHDFRAVERLCSVGAAELLMPRNDLRMAV